MRSFYVLKKYDADYDCVVKFVTFKRKNATCNDFILFAIALTQFFPPFCGNGTLNAPKKLAKLSFSELKNKSLTKLS